MCTKQPGANPCTGSLIKWLFADGKRVSMGHVPMGADFGKVFITASFHGHVHEVIAPTVHDALVQMLNIVEG